MTNPEILQRVLEKAIKNGYVLPERGSRDIFIDSSNTAFLGLRMTFSAVDVIFSHDFNKAFWGEYWMPRLQTMVLEKDPIEYLGKYL